MLCHLQVLRVIDTSGKRLKHPEGKAGTSSVEKSVRNLALIKAALIYSSILFLCLHIRSTPLWLPSAVGCLADTLFCPFVISAS
jgi:hypothetical protein